MYKFVIWSLFLLGLNTINQVCAADSEQEQFIQHMVKKHDFDPILLHDLFQKVQKSEAILQAIARPAEKLPWYQYREIFLKPDRISQGVVFWQQNLAVLRKAEQTYGVPAEIIVAVIGVETWYGKYSGKYRVMDALTTLAFHYPKRSEFFRSELEQYLLLTREQNIEPLSIKGSYAGAMGIPQFISSSYRNFAVDFDGDGRINLWTDHTDAIGSVANYFAKHGWRKGGTVVVKADVNGNSYTQHVNDELEPKTAFNKLANDGVVVHANLSASTMAKLIELELHSANEYWLGLHNFYVITRYNHSALYAMAVYQLSQEIRSRFLNKP